MNRKIKRPEDPEIDEEFETESYRLARAKMRERQAKEEIGHATDNLLPMFQGRGITRHRIDFDPHTWATIRLKKRETDVIDEDRLKSALGAEAFNKLTTKRLDHAKLEAAIRLGEIDPTVVAACQETTETPYLETRFNQKRKGRRG